MWGWTGKSWSNTNIDRLHHEVNDLKHSPQGLYGGRNVAYAVAAAAVDQWLQLFEAWPDLRWSVKEIFGLRVAMLPAAVVPFLR
jgi:hypothetical protein